MIRVFAALVLVVCFTACSDETKIHRTLKAVGAAKLRDESLTAVNKDFPREGVTQLAQTNWPPAVRAFQPMAVWTEPDGMYLLLDSDAGGERGIFLPRVVSDKDPVCNERLTHVKLDSGVYWYQRKRG